ncbi:hypothetical protein [Clostridium lacusfryxellense]|uniref:hypothetical protein n=1 Tax=Clostridium lacusfryxellense TaxID=205328 RepID=UPI001C0DF290|nr:hypothetical protein [Clostridium lacusfryxellense]MBU3112098.1 hypothetical protein [Clostridium lacusfryxellense]
MKNMKSTSILIIAIIFILVFVGCGSDPMEATVNITNKIYSNTLKELVTSKTITQSQSDKVIVEVLRNTVEARGNTYVLGYLVECGTITKLQADIIDRNIQITMKKM